MGKRYSIQGKDSQVYMYIRGHSNTSLRSLAGWAKGSLVSWGFLKLVGVLQFWLNVQRDKFCWPLPFYSFWGCQAESLLEADRVVGPSSQGQPCLYYSHAQQICLRLWDCISQLVGLNPTLSTLTHTTFCCSWWPPWPFWTDCLWLWESGTL